VSVELCGDESAERDPERGSPWEEQRERGVAECQVAGPGRGSRETRLRIAISLTVERKC